MVERSPLSLPEPLFLLICGTDAVGVMLEHILCTLVILLADWDKQSLSVLPIYNR